jgi:hypothetical protein
MLTSVSWTLIKDTLNSNNTLKYVQLIFEKWKIVVSNVKITTFVFLTSVPLSTPGTLVSMTHK